MPPTFFCQRGWQQLCEHVDSLTEVSVVTAAFASSRMRRPAEANVKQKIVSYIATYSSNGYTCNLITLEQWM